jgi:8-oxo-dGTP pyrophosphatase MutT (NUDIX family)
VAELRSAPDWRACIRERLAGTEPRHDSRTWLLPGLTAEQTQAIRARLPCDPIPAAVLVPLVERDSQLTVLLTQRAAHLKSHSGQISFPGGRLETGETPLEGALREAREEVGLESGFVTLAGYLPDHILTSGFRVTPVVAFVRAGFIAQPHAREVEEVFEVPLDFIFEPGNHRPRRWRMQGVEPEIELRDIPYGGRIIWGATAGILFSLYRLCAGELQ